LGNFELADLRPGALHARGQPARSSRHRRRKSYTSI